MRQGVQDAAKDSSVQVQLIETNAQGDISKESTFVDTLVARNVDAIIYRQCLKMAVAVPFVAPVKRVFR
ncbi:ABC transporter substrate-binding protein [Escherichia coli]|nr:ABC transporter substrate-binding protein [Escherichia coli]